MKKYRSITALLAVILFMGAVLFMANCGENGTGPGGDDDDDTLVYVVDTTTYPGLVSNASYLTNYMAGDFDSGGVLIFVKQADNKAYFVDFRDSVWVVKKLCDVEGVQSPLISPDGKYVTFWTGDEDGADIYITHLKAGYPPKKVASGFDPHWWIDPSSGKYYIVYATETGKQNWPQTGSTKKLEVNPETRVAGMATELLDKSFNGGLSKNGQYLCTAYESTDMYDLVNSTHFALLSGLQSCNASITPSVDPATQNRMLHLGLGVTLDGTAYGMHEVFMVRNTADSVLWYEEMPYGTDEWQKPEWSTHEDYAVATAKKNNEYNVYVVRIIIGDHNTGDYFRIIEGDNIYPHLWINE